MPSAAMACPAPTPVSNPSSSSNGSHLEVGSLEHLRSSDAFPKCVAERLGQEVESAVEFPLLPGEAVSRFGRAGRDARVFLTNYRLLVLQAPAGSAQPAFVDVALLSLEAVEMRELFTLIISTKDGRVIRVSCDTNEDCLSWFKVLTGIAVGHDKREKIFAFAYRAWCLDEARKQPKGFLSNAIGMSHAISPDATKSEFDRLQFDERIWRISNINENYELCGTYPESWILPVSVGDELVRGGAPYRWLKRAPALVWRHRGNGAILLRSSQPSPGLFSWRNEKDEELLVAFAAAAAAQPSSPSDPPQPNPPTPQPLLIIDARSYAAAWANRAKGGGFESPEYYQKSQVQFMGLANIHAIRNSFSQLRSLLGGEGVSEDGATWLQSLQSSAWLQHLSLLLSAGVRAAAALEDEARCVLVHCSDGWDRTPQILSLTRLLLDPEARTLKGFRTLVERDWVEFGHKFEDRLGLLAGGNPSERSPVFLQFLDAVNQLMGQFPLAFQFNRSFLVKLAQHCYSGLFGTFLCNSVSDIAREKVRERTFPVWAFLSESQFHNLLYEPSRRALWPQTHVSALFVWRALYAPDDNAPPKARKGSFALERPLNRTHSCDSLNSESSLGAQVLPPASPNTAALHRAGSDSNLPLSLSSSILNESDDKLPDLNVSDAVEEIVNGVSEEEDTAGPNGTATPKTAFDDFHTKAGVAEAMDALRLSDECDRRESFTEDPLWEYSSAPSHISTSTSDISDSLVRRVRTKGARGHSRPKENRRRKELRDWLDPDGLPTALDPVQERMRLLNNHYQRRMEVMESELQRLRTKLRSERRSGGDCPSCVPRNPSGQTTSQDSEWLEVEEEGRSWPGEEGWEGLSDDATKWIPDHAVSHCMGCDTAFWAINRRHHCRSCGKVFCSRCSQSSCPVPDEALFEAVRVCNSCYEKLATEPNGGGGEATDGAAESPISACA